MKNRLLSMLILAAILLAIVPEVSAANTKDASSDAPGSFTEAKKITVNQRYTDNISDRYDNDYFCFTLSAAGTVNLSFEHGTVFSQEEYWAAWLYNAQTEEICTYSFDGANTSTTTYTVGLPAGTYYLRIVGGAYSSSSYRFSTEDYSFNVIYAQTSLAEKENNNTFATATNISLNQSYTASINDRYDNDYFKFTLSKAGTVALKFDRSLLADAKEYWVAWLYNDQTEEICAYSLDGANTSTTTYTVGLPAGTYYLRIVGGDYSSSSYRFSTEDYSFKLIYTQTNFAEKENNETFATATNISLNQSYTASINDRYDNDYFKFTLSKAGTVALKFDRSLLADAKEYWVAWLYNDQTEEICAYSLDGANTSTTSYTVGLPAGTYYLRIVGGDYSSSSYRFSTEDYSFMLIYTQTNFAERENNETFATATAIALNQSYAASINDKYDKDYYKFSVDQESNLSIVFENPELSSTEEYWVVSVFDSQNKKIASFSVYGSYSTTIGGPITFSAGDYYLLITGGNFYSSSYRYSTEVYKVAVSSISHTHSYTDLTTPPTCTKQGYTTHTCDCGYSYTDNYVNALGHNYGAWAQTKAPSCTTKGEEKHTCSRCGTYETREIAATGHYYSNGVCTVCGAKDPNYKPAGSVSFVDVSEKDWYYAAVQYTVQSGLMNGTGNGRFEPEERMTRAMLVTVLWRYEGQPSAGKNTFSDVPEGEWYTKAVAWAAENGIVGGVGNNKFDPNGNITREQMATILFRYARKKGINTSKRGDLSGFPDENMVSDYAKAPVQWAVAEKTINGSDGKLLPQGNATRAQVSAILMRFIENNVK